MKNLNIAIIGAGTAGLAAASFLARDGHQVTLYEKFQAPKPLGAGLLLQPTGLSALSLLGLDKDIIAKGSRIDQLLGKVSGHTMATLDVRYKEYAKHLHGLGIHRGALFSALYNAALESGVTIIASSKIDDVVDRCLRTENGETYGPFDMIVDASGAGSALRSKYAQVKLDKPYPYGAVWGTVKNMDDTFCLHTLAQRYKNAYHMIGVLPVGDIEGQEGKHYALFWSMKVEDYPAWRELPFRVWQDYVISLWPEAASLINQFKTHDDLTLATYRDVILKQYHTDNIVFIGDAAHCTSPQLGQGANLALLDAMVLSECVNKYDTVGDVLTAYTKRRKKHLWFYQMASRMLTPFFQSDSILCAKLRFLTCAIGSQIRFARRLMAHVLTGTMTGPFSTLNPGDWAPDYDLHKRPEKTIKQRV